MKGWLTVAAMMNSSRSWRCFKKRWEKFEDGDGNRLYEWFCQHKAVVILKNKVDYKQNQLLEFVEKLKQVIDDQEKEVEKAVIQRGKYRFKSEYKYLEVPESQWYK